MDFETRFTTLNTNQRAAVEQIFGPLLIIAGPGTGKTELLSMRAAQILRQTDTLPSNILCLTFTDSGAANMRERLRQIIGEEAYKVAIHTFHSFGVEIINQHREYFFQGGEFKPADELAQYQIMRTLFDGLDWQHPLAKKNGEGYVYLSDVATLISEFKKSGLTADELREIIASNQQVIDAVATDISDIFAAKITKAIIPQFAALAQKVAQHDQTTLPAGISSYAGTLALSIAHAAQEALDIDKTTPITAWKKAWCDKDNQQHTVLKDALHSEKLLAAIDLYDQYEAAMRAANLYDYDDMILSVIHAIETHASLRANLQEQFQYLMVDEFQDTNLAQLRLLFSLTEGESPNVMAVGDDDQAIFSFQGADLGNIQRFRERFNDPPIIVLRDNYRSAPEILTSARTVITQGDDRLENTITDLSKELTPQASADGAEVRLYQYDSPGEERSAIASSIRALIDQGTPPEHIAVLARRHHELVDLLPYLTKQHILVNYERRDNALEHELIKLLELLARVIVATAESDHTAANALLPELLAHPAFGFSPHDIWTLSLSAWSTRMVWLESMQTNPTFKPFADWLLERSVASITEPLEAHIDTLLGIDTKSQKSVGDPEDIPKHAPYTSPIHAHFFSPEQLAEHPDAYLDALEALRTIRDQLREHYTTQAPTLKQFLSFLDLYHQLGATLTIVRHRADHQSGHINLMTAHKSKGLEFEHVFVIGAIDSAWGEKVRSRSRLIRYPANLPLQPAGNTYDERLRLFFVAMTRAKRTLTVSFSAQDSNGKPTLVASFLSQQPSIEQHAPNDIAALIEAAEIDWRGYLTRPITTDLKTLLAPTLEAYKLSATHLNNFLDVSRGGPQTFLLNNLLRFPSSKTANASYGTAMHAALQQAHNTVRVDGALPATETILDNFTALLREQHLSDDDFALFNVRGRNALDVFIQSHGSSFTATQLTELSFAGQGITIGDAQLTGTLDLADIDTAAKTIRVTDYKTGSAARDWRGTSDYEKIKLHKYRQQLMFYQLLVEHSRDYSGYTFSGAALQFVEPEPRSGEILALEDTFSEEDLDQFKQLIAIIWQKIITLDLPDISRYEPNYRGLITFEQDLLDIK